MNKRIEELLCQALDKAVPETWTTLTPEQLTKVSEKFAELLLKECIKVCEPVFLDESYEDMSEFGKGLVEGQDVAVEKIKEHFGVEE